MGGVIRWGLWGTGQLARHVAEDFARVPGAVLSSVASRSEARARAFAASHSILRPVTGLDALLRADDLDAVFVASPNACHVDERSPSSRPARRSWSRSRSRSTRPARVASPRRHGRAASSAWKRCGRASSPRCRGQGARRPRRARRRQAPAGRLRVSDRPAQRTGALRRAAGGGALLDRGVYLVSLAHHLLGRPERASGLAVRHANADDPSVLHGSGVDAQSVFQLRFASGAVAAFSASLVAQGRNDFHIVGDRGRLTLARAVLPRSPAHGAAERRVGRRTTVRGVAEGRLEGRAARIGGGAIGTRGARSALRRLGGERTTSLSFPGHGYQFELAEASRCIAAGLRECPTMTLDDSIAVMETLDALRISFAAHDEARR